MPALDFMLNLACLVLWLSWRSVPLPTAPAMSLGATVQRTDRRRGARWSSLAAVLIVLALRSVFYWHVGPLVNWTPSLDVGVVRLPFRSDYFNRALWFSFLSFGLTLGCFYACLLLLSIVNHRLGNDEPIHRFIRVHIGRVDQLPLFLKLLLPLIISSAGWLLVSHELSNMGILPARPSLLAWAEQGLLVGLVSYFVWKVLLLIVCGLYLVQSYVYLGESSFWRYVQTTGGNILRPLRRLPVVIGKIDLSPLLLIALVLAVTRFLSWGLLRAYQCIPW